MKKHRYTAVSGNFAAGVLSPAAQDDVTKEQWQSGAEDLLNFEVLRDGGIRSRPPFVRSSSVIAVPGRDAVGDGRLDAPQQAAVPGDGASAPVGVNVPVRRHGLRRASEVRGLVDAQAEPVVLYQARLLAPVRAVTWHGARLRNPPGGWSVIIGTVDEQGGTTALPRLVFTTQYRLRGTENWRGPTQASVDPLGWRAFAPGRISRDIVVPFTNSQRSAQIAPDADAVRLILWRYREEELTLQRPPLRLIDLEIDSISAYTDAAEGIDGETLAAVRHERRVRLIPWVVRNIPFVLALSLEEVALYYIDGTSVDRIAGTSWYFTARQLRELTWALVGQTMLLLHRDFPYPLQINLFDGGSLEVRPLPLSNLPQVPSDLLQQANLDVRIRDATADISATPISGEASVEPAVTPVGIEVRPRVRAVFVRWPGTRAVSYNVFWRPAGTAEGSVGEETVAVGATGHLITGLPPGRDFQVQVQSETYSRTTPLSERSEAVRVRALYPGLAVPGGIRIIARRDAVTGRLLPDVRVVWERLPAIEDAIAGLSIEYEVEHGYVGGTETRERVSDTGMGETDERDVSIGQGDGRTFRARVRARYQYTGTDWPVSLGNPAGLPGADSGWSEYATLVTDLEEPFPPENLRLGTTRFGGTTSGPTGVGAYGAILRWDVGSATTQLGTAESRTNPRFQRVMNPDGSLGFLDNATFTGLGHNGTVPADAYEVMIVEGDTAGDTHDVEELNAAFPVTVTLQSLSTTIRETVVPDLEEGTWYMPFVRSVRRRAGFADRYSPWVGGNIPSPIPPFSGNNDPRISEILRPLVFRTAMATQQTAPPPTNVIGRMTPVTVGSAAPTNSVLTATCAPVMRAAKYQSQYQRVGDTTWSDVTNYVTSGSPAVRYTGLIAGTSYRIRIRAGLASASDTASVDGATGWSVWRSLVQSTTGMAPVDLTAPRNPSLIPLSGTDGQTQMRLEWQSATNHDGYEAQILHPGHVNANEEGWRPATPRSLGMDATETLFRQLVADTEYQGRVRSTRGAERSDWVTTEVTSTRGVADTTRTATPTGFRGTPVAGSHTSLRLDWNAVVGATGYNLLHRQKDSASWRETGANIPDTSAMEWDKGRGPARTSTTQVGGSVTSRTFTGLEEDTEYEFIIRAIDTTKGANDQPSEWHPVIAVRTTTQETTTPSARPGIPSGLTLAPEETAIGVSWTLGANATGTEVQWSLAAEDTWTLVPVEGRATTARITGLTAGTEYKVRARSVWVRTDGTRTDSEYTTPVRATTTGGEPTATLPTPRARQIAFNALANGGSATIGWPREEGDRADEYVTLFRLQAPPDPDDDTWSLAQRERTRRMRAPQLISGEWRISYSWNSGAATGSGFYVERFRGEEFSDVGYVVVGVGANSIGTDGSFSLGTLADLQSALEGEIGAETSEEQANVDDFLSGMGRIGDFLADNPGLTVSVNPAGLAEITGFSLEEAELTLEAMSIAAKAFGIATSVDGSVITFSGGARDSSGGAITDSSGNPIGGGGEDDDRSGR